MVECFLDICLRNFMVGNAIYPIIFILLEFFDLTAYLSQESLGLYEQVLGKIIHRFTSIC